MNKILIASVAVVGLFAAAPASAQVAFGGDGIFGHEYRTQTAASSAPGTMAAGYADEATQGRSGSARAVAAGDRAGRDTHAVAAASTSRHPASARASRAIVDIRR